MQLMTTSEVARLTNVAESTVRSWERTGRLIPAQRTGSGLRLYDRQIVEQVARRRKASRPTAA